MIPNFEHEILPALREVLRPQVRLGKHAANIRFELGTTSFGLRVTPHGVKLVEGPLSDAATVTMSADELLAAIAGSLDLHVRFIRGEVDIKPKDPETQIVVGGVLVRLIALLALGPLRGTLLEELYLAMDFRTYRSSIPAPYARRLYELVREYKPEHTLEIGIAHGLSTLGIALALEHNGRGRHYANDPFQAELFKNAGLQNVARAGLASRVVHLDKPDYLALPELVASGTRFQFAFIDGCHFVDYTMVDVFYSDLLLDVGGILAIDDVHLADVDAVVKYLLEQRASSYEPLPAASTERIAVFRKRAADDRVDLNLPLARGRRV